MSLSLVFVSLSTPMRRFSTPHFLRYEEILKAMQETYLVTGGGGFIGVYVIKNWLRKEGKL